ncbi:MAG: HAD family phosphatase [Puniceicoccales bacterium]|nr:HAD family phosphatase [Puniceicoccales bacterium]
MVPNSSKLEYMLQSSKKAFIFDCDGTIGDTMGLYFRAWNATLRDLGVSESLSWEEFCANGGRSFAVSIDEYGKKYGFSFDVERFVKLLDHYYEDLLPHFLPIAPVVDLIRRENVRPMAVGSSGLLRNVSYVLDHLELRKKFRAVVTQEDVVRDGVIHTKPEPDLFLIAAERIGVAPADCLVFDDSPLGAAAARSAGMDFFRIPSSWWDLRLRDGKIPV